MRQNARLMHNRETPRYTDVSSRTVFVRVSFFLDHPSETAPARVELFPVFVSDLSAGPTSSILSTLREALVEIRPDDPLIQLGAADVLQAVQRVLVGVVFDEAEAARRLREPIEAHHEALDLAAGAEERVDLLLGRVEAEVAHVQRRRVRELVLDIWRGRAVPALIIAVIPAASLVLRTKGELAGRRLLACLSH